MPELTITTTLAEATPGADALDSIQFCLLLAQLDGQERDQVGTLIASLLNEPA